jgi:hypothetical protein
MIVCDFCRLAAVRRVHVDQAAWYEASRSTKYLDFNDVADHYQQLSVSRYSCWDHLAEAYEDVVGRVDPGVPVVLDAEL